MHVGKDLTHKTLEKCATAARGACDRVAVDAARLRALKLSKSGLS
jgi:hypothetical protein